MLVNRGNLGGKLKRVSSSSTRSGSGFRLASIYPICALIYRPLSLARVLINPVDHSAVSANLLYIIGARF